MNDDDISEVLTIVKTLKIFKVVGMKQLTLNGFKILEKQKHENLEFVNCSCSPQLVQSFNELQIILENYCLKFKKLVEKH